MYLVTKGRLRSQEGCKLPCFIEHPLGGHHSIDQTDPPRLTRIDRFARQEHLECPTGSDQTRKPLGPAKAR